jgi:hypothetical protein
MSLVTPFVASYRRIHRLLDVGVCVSSSSFLYCGTCRQAVQLVVCTDEVRQQQQCVDVLCVICLATGDWLCSLKEGWCFGGPVLAIESALVGFTPRVHPS